MTGDGAVRAAERGREVIFSMTDPQGDDFGPGGYYYPTHETFKSHPGLFDLLKLVVAADQQEVSFDLTFTAVDNPWRAPEGSSHIRTDIYIDTQPRTGSTATWHEGANVRFLPEHGWEYLVRLAPWGESIAVKSGSGDDATAELKASLRETSGAWLRTQVKLARVGEDTLRARVPLGFLGRPRRDWRYYVLVGSFDAFGPDNYRPITAKGGSWVFGGGDDGSVAPNVLDILAPRLGRYSQARQLSSFDGSSGLRATLYPADANPGGFALRGPIMALALLATAAAIVWWGVRGRVHRA
jgi:carbohydrate-binding DOMON domain-containing protein